MRFPCTVPLSLISHGRGEISSWLWEDLSTAVGGIRHGCDEVTISVAKINYIREKSKVFLLVVGIYMPCSI